jgi:radical SAM/Cys-rich protein
MHATLPLLQQTDFPPIARRGVEILQINVGYRCNQSCVHCHVNAGPTRSEAMSREVAEEVLDYLRRSRIRTLDITGGAPELNAQFRYLVKHARAMEVQVMDRCNLTILEEPGQEDLVDFLAGHRVRIVASLPCYLEDNVDCQRGDGVFQKSLRALRKLNAVGYAEPDSDLTLDLVYNPQGPSLPPNQHALEQDYRRILTDHHGVAFNQLYTLANMPIARFGSTLISKGQFGGYMRLLKRSHRPENLEHVMCRSLLSVDWQGYVYDCDFNQMLGLPLKLEQKPRVRLRDLQPAQLIDNPIQIADHCYGCTAGQGSSCGGALG